MTFGQGQNFGNTGYTGSNAGGFRPDLNLSEMMGHYSMWLNGQGPSTPPQTLDSPFQVGYGPRTCSTETALVQRPLICWDVQGYYKIMGVHWKATKRELMKAYQSFGPMPSSRQTYVFKMLLDPVMRNEYDNWPLGVPFMHDIDVQMWLKKKAMEMARRYSEQSGENITPEDVLDQWGMKMEPDEVVDGEVEKVDADRAEPAKSPARTAWLYSWFSWRSGSTDTEILRVWQELLIRVLSDLGERVQLAVGFAGRTEARYVIGEVQGTTVVFLSDKEEPTPEIAGAAAQALLNDLHKT